MRLILLLLLVCLAAPAWAQLDYAAPPKSGPTAPTKHDTIQAIVKKTRGSETVLRPDWYGLFLLWAKENPSLVLAGLRDPAAFENFSRFMGCDYVRDFRTNDIAWPQRQVQVIEAFNQRTLNPQRRFRLLTFAVLGPYVREQQQFVFRPLEGAAFSIKFAPDKNFGVEDDCQMQAVTPLDPWPAEFVIGFGNPDFIKALPMEALRAEYFLQGLPKNEKGEVDRRLVVEVEFDVKDFAQTSPAKEANRPLPPVQVTLLARRAIIYADSERKKELARVGF